MSARVELPIEKADVTAITLNAVVKGKNADGETWKEVADIISVSASGAGFYLERECQVGTLVSLIVPLPANQRCYDHDKELYRIWGLIQHCNSLSGEDQPGYHIGVAFIGKNAPESYREDAMQGYKICGMNEDGLWKVKEAKTAFKARRDVRYWKAIDLYLAIVDPKRGSVGGERTTTENISKGGAAVLSNLDVNVGDRVKFISEQFDFSGLAVVCNRQIGDDRRARLHLKFVENKFPIKNLDLNGPNHK